MTQGVNTAKSAARPGVKARYGAAEPGNIIWPRAGTRGLTAARGGAYLQGKGQPVRPGKAQAGSQQHSVSSSHDAHAAQASFADGDQRHSDSQASQPVQACGASCTMTWRGCVTLTFAWLPAPVVPFRTNEWRLEERLAPSAVTHSTLHPYNTKQQANPHSSCMSRRLPAILSLKNMGEGWRYCDQLCSQPCLSSIVAEINFMK